MGRTISIQEQQEMGITPGTYHVFNNVGYITSCFDSIKLGDPDRITLGGDASITCLEHILSDIISTGDIKSKSTEQINPLIFEYLADPSINLNASMCSQLAEIHGIYAGSESCIPRIIETYAALKQYKRPLSNADGTPTTGKNAYNDEAYNKVVAEMRSITRKYPHYLAENCRKRRTGELISCLDAIIGQSNNWRAIDLNTIDPSIFVESQCTNPVYPGSDKPIPCIESIIRNALLNNDGYHSVGTAYANTLLQGILSRDRFDPQTIHNPDACGDGVYASCFDFLLNNMSGANNSPYKAVYSVLNRFRITDSTDSHKFGIIDTQSPTSAFSGEQCVDIYGGVNAINCLDLLIKRAIDVETIKTNNGEIKLTTKSTSGDDAAFHDTMQILEFDPRYVDNPCKTLDLISESYDKNPGKLFRYHGYVLKLIGISYPVRRGDVYNALKTSSMKRCVDASVGTDISLLNYITDKPMVFNFCSSTDSVELIASINRESCTSRYGTVQNCIAKIIDKWMNGGKDGNIDPKYKHQVESLIDLSSQFHPKSNLTNHVMGYISDDEKNLYDADGSIKLRIGDTTPPFNDYLVGELQTAVDATDSDNYDRIGALNDIFVRVLRNGSPMDYARVDALSSDIYNRNQGFGSCESFVNYIITMQTNHLITKDDVKSIIEKSGLLFLGSCIENSVYFLKAAYVDADNDLKEVIKTRFTPSVDVADDNKEVVDKSYRYKVEMYLHKTLPNDLRYKNEPFGSTTLDPVHEFYYYLNPDKRTDNVENITYTPNPDDLWNYDVSCMRDMNAGKKYSGENAFVEDVINNKDFATSLRPEEFGIVGTYQVIADPRIWSTERRIRYGNAVRALIYGGDSVNAPYVKPTRNNPREEIYFNNGKGLINALKAISKSEPVGQRKDNITATPVFRFQPELNLRRYNMNSDLRVNDNDVTVTVMYINDATGEEIPKMTKKFPFRTILQNLPKKILTSLQEGYKDLFGTTQLVATYEREVEKAGANTYIMNISNRPIDELRLSTGQNWDRYSCMSFGENAEYDRYTDTNNNIAVKGYIDFRSFVAYLTKDSPYEPKWLARMQMHRCHDAEGHALLTAMHDRESYDVTGGSHTYFHILNDAATLVLSENEVNSKCSTGRCEHYWHGQTDGKGFRYKDYTDDGMDGGRCRNYSMNSDVVRKILSNRIVGDDKNPELFVKKISDTF